MLSMQDNKNNGCNWNRLCDGRFQFSWRERASAPAEPGGVTVPTQYPEPWFAGAVQLPAVELQANDGEHEDGKEEQQADLQQGNHRFHDGL